MTARTKSDSLPVLEPEIGAIPDISEDARANLARARALYRSIDSAVASYPDIETARKHLTPKQMEIWEHEEEYSREDHLEVGPVGCSWYCGGGPDRITASGTLPPRGPLTYDAENAHDFSLRTAWVEGAPGAGIGESISYRFPKGSPPVTTVIIHNGYMKSEQAWKDNARIRQLLLRVNGKPAARLNLQDTKAAQIFAIGPQQGIRGDLTLRFEIAAVYPGDRYEDAALAELEFDGTGVHCFTAGTPVATPSGDRPIETLAIGDTVLSLNEGTGRPEAATVLGLSANRHHNLCELSFGTLCITVTDDHPFYFRGATYAVRANMTYGWPAKPLRAGQEISFLKDGALMTRRLTGIRELTACEQTYTVTRLSRNRFFFAGGACVAAEETDAAL